eukprot:m.1123193 g.1123193  ORF g.1123193 m.1123193 type:complete len:1146 (-) comp24404_c1_seq4:2905-6342(-)
MASASTNASAGTRQPLPIMSARSCPAIHIPKPSDEKKSTLRVYRGKNISAPGCEYKSVPVATSTTSLEVITDALQKFGVQDHAIHYELRYTRQINPKHRRFLRKKLGKGPKSHTLLTDECPLIVSDAYDDDRFFEIVRRKGASVSKSKAPAKYVKHPSVAASSHGEDKGDQTSERSSHGHNPPQLRATFDEGGQDAPRPPFPLARRAMTAIDVRGAVTRALPSVPVSPPSEHTESPDYASILSNDTKASPTTKTTAFYSPVVARPLNGDDFKPQASASGAPPGSPLYTKVVRKSQRLPRRRTREMLVLHTDQARPAPPPVPQRAYKQQHATKATLLRVAHQRTSELPARAPPPPPPTSTAVAPIATSATPVGQHVASPAGSTAEDARVDLYSPQSRMQPPHHTLNSTRIPRHRAGESGARNYDSTRMHESTLMPPEIDMSMIPFRCNSTDTGSSRIGASSPAQGPALPTPDHAPSADLNASSERVEASLDGGAASAPIDTDATAVTEASLDDTPAADTTNATSDVSEMDGSTEAGATGDRGTAQGTGAEVMMVPRSVPLLPVPPLMRPAHQMIYPAHVPWQRHQAPPPPVSYQPVPSWHAHPWGGCVPSGAPMLPTHPPMHGLGGPYPPPTAHALPPPPPLASTAAWLRTRQPSGGQHRRSSGGHSGVQRMSNTSRSSSVNGCDGSVDSGRSSMGSQTSSHGTNAHRSPASATPASPSSRKADCQTLDECEIAIRDLEMEKTKFRGLANKRRRQKINVMIRSLQQLWQDLFNESNGSTVESASERSSFSSAASLNPAAAEFVPTTATTTVQCPASTTTVPTANTTEIADTPALSAHGGEINTPGTQDTVDPAGLEQKVESAGRAATSDSEETSPAAECTENGPTNKHAAIADGEPADTDGNKTVLDDPLPDLPADAPVDTTCTDGVFPATATTPVKNSAAGTDASVLSTDGSDPLPATPACDTPVGPQSHRVSKRTVLLAAQEAIPAQPSFAVPVPPTKASKLNKENPVAPAGAGGRAKAPKGGKKPRGLSARSERGANDPDTSTGAGGKLDISAMAASLKCTGIALTGTDTPARKKSVKRRVKPAATACDSPTVLSASMIRGLNLKKTGNLTPRVKGMQREAIASQQTQSPSTLSFQEKKALWK